MYWSRKSICQERSRSLIPADKETINAVIIDPASMVRVKHFFFPNSVSGNFKDELQNAVIDEFEKLRKDETRLLNQVAPVTEISKEQLKTVTEDLKNNPPLNPDYKRIVEIYSNKFRYVKLKFVGSGIQNIKISLPRNSLPIANAELKKRLEAKLNLFNRVDMEDTFSELNELIKKEKSLRKAYLTKVKSREESLLNNNNKIEFDKAIASFNKEIADVQDKTIDKVDNKIGETKKNILTELTNFIVQNPESFFDDQYYLVKEKPDTLKTASKAIAEEIVQSKMTWPMAYKLVGKFRFDVTYSDITYEDLKNEKFIDELLKSGLINEADKNQLSEFSKGIEIKKNDPTLF